MRVLVCGFPGSGNSLIVNHINRSKNAEAFMDHGQNKMFFRNLAEICDAIIFPIRLMENDRIESCQRRGFDFGIPRENQIKYMERIAEYGKDIPKYSIIYEEILRSGGGTLDNLLIGMGIQVTPWPEAVTPEALSKGRVITETQRKTFRQYLKEQRENVQ